MRSARSRAFVVAGLFAVVMTVIGVGCGGGGGSDPLPLDVTGIWTLSATGHPTMTLNLTHAGTAITGTVSDSTNYSRRVSGSTVAPMGSLDPRTVTLVVTFSDGQIATYSGTVNDDNTSMSGRYSTNWGTADSWRATRS